MEKVWPDEPGGLMACSPSLMDAVHEYAPYTKENAELLALILNYSDRENVEPLFDMIAKYNQNDQKITEILQKAFAR